MQIERRAAVEFKLDGRRLEGYAATFGTRATIADFTEEVRAGAVSASLTRGDDVVALVDHDRSRLLGRTRSKTLHLAEDDRGLRFSIDLAETTLARDILALAERGDLGGASFAFRVPKGGDEWRGRDRTLLRVDLVDVSVVQTFPAYPNTEVQARAHQPHRLPLSLAKRYLGAMR